MAVAKGANNYGVHYEHLDNYGPTTFDQRPSRHRPSPPLSTMAPPPLSTNYYGPTVRDLKSSRDAELEYLEHRTKKLEAERDRERGELAKSRKVSGGLRVMGTLVACILFPWIVLTLLIQLWTKVLDNPIAEEIKSFMRNYNKVALAVFLVGCAMGLMYIIYDFFFVMNGAQKQGLARYVGGQVAAEICTNFLFSQPA